MSKQAESAKQHEVEALRGLGEAAVLLADTLTEFKGLYAPDPDPNDTTAGMSLSAWLCLDRKVGPAFLSLLSSFNADGLGGAWSPQQEVAVVAIREAVGEIIRAAKIVRWTVKSTGARLPRRSVALPDGDRLNLTAGSTFWLIRQPGKLADLLDGLLARLAEQGRVLAERGADGEKAGGSAASPVEAGADIPLDAEEVKILRALSKSHPQLQSLYDLETATGMTRKTIGPRVNGLIDAGLAERPKGKHGGVALTTKGRNAVPQDTP